ncbi:hypothetical protein TB1_011186 [Malus domestica]
MLTEDELESLGFKGERLGLGENEIRCFTVLGIWVGRVDFDESSIREIMQRWRRISFFSGRCYSNPFSSMSEWNGPQYTPT